MGRMQGSARALITQSKEWCQVRFDMKDYCEDCLAMYTEVTGCDKFKKVLTPFCSEGSLVAADELVQGQLGEVNVASLLAHQLFRRH